MPCHFGAYKLLDQPGYHPLAAAIATYTLADDEHAPFLPTDPREQHSLSAPLRKGRI